MVTWIGTARVRPSGVRLEPIGDEPGAAPKIDRLLANDLRPIKLTKSLLTNRTELLS